MAFDFKNTKQDNTMNQEDENQFRDDIICQFYEKILNLIKLEIIGT